MVERGRNEPLKRCSYFHGHLSAHPLGLLFVIKHLSAHNLAKLKRQKERNKENKQFTQAVLTLLFVKGAVILNHAAVSSSKETVG